MNREIIERILDASVRAPSGDNVQAWFIKVSEDCKVMSIFDVPERDESYFNYNQLASLVAIGALIENIVIAAKNFQYEANIELFPDQSNDKLIARVTFDALGEADSYLYNEIFDRYTNRFKYKYVKISDEDKKKLMVVASKINNVNTHFVFDIGVIGKLAKVMMLNDKIVFEKKDIHSFLFRQIRWTEAQANASQNGMPLGTLGLNFLEKLLFPLMRFWWFVNCANYFGLSWVIGFKFWQNCRSASILGMISVDQNDKYSYVQAGRAMQRIWLEATRQNLAFQPIAGLAFLISRLNCDALVGFSDRQRLKIASANENMIKLFGIAECDTMIMGFRIGMGPAPSVRTRRMSAWKFSG